MVVYFAVFRALGSLQEGNDSFSTLASRALLRLVANLRVCFVVLKTQLQHDLCATSLFVMVV